MKNLSRAFVNNFPTGIFFYPVLAFACLRAEIVAAVFLVVIDDHHIFNARVAEQAHIVDADLDPGFAGKDLAFLCCPRVKFFAVAGEVGRVMRQLFVRVQTFPVSFPATE